MWGRWGPYTLLPAIPLRLYEPPVVSLFYCSRVLRGGGFMGGRYRGNLREAWGALGRSREYKVALRFIP